MKTHRLWIGWVMVLFMVGIAVPAVAESDKGSFVVNQQQVQLDPAVQVLSDGQVRVPARGLLHPLGVQFAWRDQTHLAAYWGQKIIQMELNTANVTVDGQPLTLTSSIRADGDELWVPFDFLTKVLGWQAEWDSKTKTVTIKDVLPRQPFPPAGVPVSNEDGTAKYLRSIMNDPVKLLDFMTALPKGADLHNHLSGAVYAEDYIKWGAELGLCIDKQFKAQTCSADVTQLISKLSETEQNNVIQSWSMENWKNRSDEKPWEHFFNTFGKFGAIAGARQGAMLAAVAKQAADENVFYLELMLSLDGGDLTTNKDIATVVARAKDRISQWEQDKYDALHCGDPTARSRGCDVQIRYISSVNRSSSNDVTYAQMLFGLAMQQADPRVVGVTLLQAEYLPGALVGYDWQMQTLNRLSRRYGGNMTLHAGELIPEVAPVDLNFHIDEAVTTAQANRIGHGNDIWWESDRSWLMDQMTSRGVMVEINLTSNQFILMTGKDQQYQHAFPYYLANGVPVALSTDDPGVERTTLPREYVKAFQDYVLSYYDIKALDRNSLIYSFLPGDSLFVSSDYAVTRYCASEKLGADNPGPICKSFLQRSPKAQLQWKLEKALTEFESRFPPK